MKGKNAKRRYITILLSLAVIFGGGVLFFWGWWMPKVTVVNRSGVALHGVTVAVGDDRTYYLGSISPYGSKSVRVVPRNGTAVRVRGVLGDGAGTRRGGGGTAFDVETGYLCELAISHQRQTVIIGPGGILTEK